MRLCLAVSSLKADRGHCLTERLKTSPADDACTNPTGFEDDILNRNSQENTMDKDKNIPSSTMEFVEQCTETHPDGYHSHDIEPAVIWKTSDDNTVHTKATPSASMPVESEVVGVAETPGVITENDRMETENKNGSTSNHPFAADDDANVDGPCDKLVNASDCSRDSKAVGNMMVVQYSRSSYNEEQLCS